MHELTAAAAGPDMIYGVAPFWESVIFIIGGLIVLVISGEFLVSGAAHLAQKHDIPKALMGLTVVAFGTSAPELVIGVSSVFQNQNDIAVGNVIGSNICNVLLVLGLPALIFTLKIVEAQVIVTNAWFMMLVTGIFIALGYFGGGLSLLDGVVLLAVLAVFLFVCFQQAREAGRVIFDEEIEELENAPLPFNLPSTHFFIWLTIVISGLGLWVGADVTVTNATAVAAQFDTVTAGIVGLSVIAFGTSLPELATTVSAAARREHAMALGNIVGSNIFNLAAIAGVTGVLAGLLDPSSVIDVHEIKPEGKPGYNIWVDMAVMVASTFALFFIIFMRRKRMGRITGLIFFLLYGLYIAYLYVPTVNMFLNDMTG